MQLQTSDMLWLCVGALLFGMLMGALKKQPKRYKYSERGSLGSKKQENRTAKIAIWVTAGCLILYAVAFVVVKLYGQG